MKFYILFHRQLHDPLNYLTSSSTVIPLLLLLILIIYYLVSLTGALREANQDLRTQLQKEREEERKKFFKVPEKKPAENNSTLTNRWRKVLDASSPVTPTQAPDFESEEYKTQARKGKFPSIFLNSMPMQIQSLPIFTELISRIMKKALRKGSATSDEDSFVRQGRDDDDTDTEHHDSLPHDEEAKEKRMGLSKLQQIRKIRKPSLVDIVQIAKSEREKERIMQQQTITGSKESHPKGRFKIERLEKKEEKEKDKDSKSKNSPDSGNDPEIKTRVINERRQSLLRKNHNNDTKDKEKKDNEKSNSPVEKRNIYESLKRKKREDKEKLHTEKQSPPKKPEEENITKSPTVKEISEMETSKPVEKRRSFRRREKSPVVRDKVKDKDSNDRSSFRVVDEKNSSSSPEEKTSTPPAMEHFHNLSGKFKFKRHKSKMSTEPEVFKFESDKIKATKSPDIATTPTLEHLESELNSPKQMEEVTTPTSGHHLNLSADKFASLSRQGRKKIGSLLALVKEAVNTKKLDQEQQSDESPTQMPETTIDIPPTLESELPTTTFKETFILPSATPVSAINSIQPYVMPRAPLEAPEDLEPLCYDSISTAQNDINTLPLKDPEELDKPTPIIFPQRSFSQRRRPSERPITMRQDSTASNWSDIIPTITISTTADAEEQPQTPVNNTTSPSSPGPMVNIIKINIEDDK